MHFSTLSTFALMLSCSAIAIASNTGSSFVPKEHYLNNVASTQLQRLLDYLSKHGGSLTTDQVAWFSKATVAISTFDTSTFGFLRTEAESLFAPGEAKFILTGKSTTNKPRRNNGSLLNKRFSCICSTTDSYCDNNTACRAGVDGCGPVGGCGTFYAYECDGLCENVN